MSPKSYGFHLASRGGIILLAAALLMAAPAPAMAQNFFEMLFGARPQPQVAAYAPPRGASRSWPRREQRLSRPGEAERSATRGLEESSKPEKVEPPPVGSGPLGPFLHDPTLRSGDVVVTTQGLMVYRGGGGSNHSPRDFASIANAGSKTSQLAAIDRANRRGNSPLLVLQTAPAAQPEPKR
jgi:hypothetical protein